MGDVRLSDVDLRRVLAASWGCDGADRTDTAVEEVLDALVSLVPADVVFWNWFDLSPSHSEHALVGSRITGLPRRAPLGPWLEHLGEHPLMSCRWGPIVSLSDVLDRHELEATWLWQEALAPAGVHHEIGVELTHPAAQVNVVVLSRGPGRDFGERDHLVLRLLRPHVDAAVRRLQTPRLTERQRSILRLVRDGYSDHQVATRLGITEATVGKHLERIYLRTGARNRAQVVNLTADLLD